MMRRSASALSAWKLVGGGPGLAPGASPPPPSRISAGTSSSAITSVSVAMIMRSTTFRSSRTVFRFHSYASSDSSAAPSTPLAQRPHAKHMHVEAIEQILPEPPRGHLRLEIAVGRRYDARVHGDRAIAAQSADLSLLDHPQQLRLRGERQLTDLVQEQRAPCSRLERTLAEHVRAGEGAALVPEQLVFDQALRKRAAVQGDERTVGSGAEAMQLPGYELLSRSAFADDQHRARNLGDARDGVLEALHGRARAHQRG